MDILLCWYTTRHSSNVMLPMTLTEYHIIIFFTVRCYFLILRFYDAREIIDSWIDRSSVFIRSLRRSRHAPRRKLVARGGKAQPHGSRPGDPSHNDVPRIRIIPIIVLSHFSESIPYRLWTPGRAELFLGTKGLR